MMVLRGKRVGEMRCDVIDKHRDERLNNLQLSIYPRFATASEMLISKQNTGDITMNVFVP